MAISVCDSIISDQGQELKEHGTTFFPIACYNNNLTQIPTPWHWHEELEAMIVVQGRARIVAGSRTLYVSAGNGAFINANTLHSAEAAPDSGADCIMRSFVFHPRLVGGSMDSVFWHKYLQPILRHPGFPGICLEQDVPWMKTALYAIEEAWNACVQERIGYEFATRDMLSRLILLLRQHLIHAEASVSGKNLRDEARIKQMLQFIHEQYASSITLPQIAGCASVSESECLRCFHSTVGVSPMAYVKKYRLQKAADLLRTTGTKIQDIGALCGFQEMSYFAKTFRKVYGCTPSEWRRQG